MEKEKSILSFLARTGWVGHLDGVEFLAAGEYNENYLVRSRDGDCLLRINHGSQLGLVEQITYEFRALQAVQPSGVTPRALFVEQHPPEEGLGQGVLLMEYLPGRPFDYRTDRDLAAGVFARIHALPVQDGLLRQEDPLSSIAEESLGLIRRFPDHPLAGERSRLLRYHERILQLAQSTQGLFRREQQCIVNTEVNSGNFIVREKAAYLVDWEKAVISCRYQDLGHFLVPTTTLWKSDYRYSEEEKASFLRAYRKEARLDLELRELMEKTAVLEKTILLRALSWCFMAYYEYSQGGRALCNPQTYQRICLYLREIENLLE